MKRIFVGIDISKDWLDLAVCREENHQTADFRKIKNTFGEMDQAFDDLVKKFGSEELWFCFEHTGHYGLLLSCILEEKKLTYTAVSALEIKRSLGLTRGKNDLVDAARIAEYASVHSHKLKASHLPGEELLQIKQLLTYRAQLVKTKTQFKNSLKSHQLANQVTQADFITNSIRQKIQELAGEIAQLEKQTEELLSNTPQLHENFRYVSSVKGIGLVIAAYLLVATQNFTAFDDPRKFTCYAGLAPFENRPGSTVRGKTQTSDLANKTIKTLLHNGAGSAINCDPQMKKYYRRKLAEGKNKRVVKNAVACKLVYRAFATVKRQSTYITFAN